MVCGQNNAGTNSSQIDHQGTEDSRLPFSQCVMWNLPPPPKSHLVVMCYYDAHLAQCVHPADKNGDSCGSASSMFYIVGVLPSSAGYSKSAPVHSRSVINNESAVLSKVVVATKELPLSKSVWSRLRKATWQINGGLKHLANCHIWNVNAIQWPYTASSGCKMQSWNCQDSGQCCQSPTVQAYAN